LDINFAKEEALSQLEHEIENKQDILANETDEEAAQKLTGEIIEERKKNGVKEKSISDRVAEFASMNKIILSEKMIYESMAEETEKETPTIPMQKNSADKLADMEQQLKDMEEMEKLLMEMEELKTATLNKQKKAA
jgi:hypothetical protein